MLRILGRIAAVLAILYLGFLTFVWFIMRQPPERFAAYMAKMPGPAMMIFPFETMWLRARGGTLKTGDAAPDFDLQTLDKTARVRLSSFRGQRPVVLVFGSYT